MKKWFLFICLLPSVLLAQATTSVFSTDEWNMMQTADSVKLFRLAELNRNTPMALPPEVYEKVEFTFEFYYPSFSAYREFYYNKSRLMSKEEQQDLFPFIDHSIQALDKFEGTCYYQPGAAIKFYKGKERFYLLMCFNCNVWAFERREAMYYVHFDVALRNVLVKYAKKLFPDDPEFQNLK